MYVLKDSIEEERPEICFYQSSGHICAEFSIGDTVVSPTWFIHRLPVKTLLEACIRPDGTVPAFHFHALYENLLEFSREGWLIVYAAPELREMVELPVPPGFALSFPRDPVTKRLAVTCSEPGFVYDGGGCFVRRNAMVRIPRLECLDPVAEDIGFIGNRHLNLFMRVLLPEIKKSVPADCGLKLMHQTPVVFTPVEWTSVKAVLDVSWRVPRASLEDPGCSGLCLSGDALYSGDYAACMDLPFAENGRYTLSGRERSGMEGLMRTNPGFFSELPALPARQPEPVGQRKTERKYDGPVLLSVAISPAEKDPPLRHLDFVRDARLKKDRQCPPTPAIPYASYWPTYASMSPGQREWYFYWRGRALEGEYLPTSLSYIFVFAYELVNGIHDHGLKRLYGVWEAYRGAYDKLDAYLPEWILDYILTYHDGNLFDLSELVVRFPLKQTPLLQYSEIFCNEALKNGFSALPPEIVCRIAEVEPAKCKVPLDRLALSIQGLEAGYARNSTSIPEAFRPHPVTVVRESFRGAIKGRRASRTITIRYLPYFTQPALRMLFKNALRYGENVLREEMGIPGRLKNEGLTPEMKAGIERALLQEKYVPVHEVDVDIALARFIEESSWQTTQQLIVEEENELPVAAADPQPVPAAGGQETEGLGAKLSDTERAFLLALLAGKPVDALCAEAFLLPEAVAETINETAYEYFGDAVIDAASLTIYDEYKPALAGQLGETSL